MILTYVGIRYFLMQDVPTYRRLTLDFLSTLEHTVQAFHYNDAEERFKFQLLNRSYDMEWGSRFGFADNNGHTQVTVFLTLHHNDECSKIYSHNNNGEPKDTTPFQQKNKPLYSKFNYTLTLNIVQHNEYKTT